MPRKKPAHAGPIFAGDLEGLVLDYIENRSQSKFPMSPLSITYFRRKVHRLLTEGWRTEKEVMAAITEAIIKGWRDIYLDPMTAQQAALRLAEDPHTFYNDYSDEQRDALDSYM